MTAVPQKKETYHAQGSSHVTYSGLFDQALDFSAR